MTGSRFRLWCLVCFFILPVNNHAWWSEHQHVTFFFRSPFISWSERFKKKKETPFPLPLPLVLFAVWHSHLFLAAVQVDLNQNTQTAGAVALITHWHRDNTASQQPRSGPDWEGMRRNFNPGIKIAVRINVNALYNVSMLHPKCPQDVSELP